MRTWMWVGALALAGLSAQAATPDRVQVTYADSAQFADFGWGKYERERNEKDLALALQSLAKGLAAGQTLHLTMRDINLAGEVEWWRLPGRELRVMRDITWPVMEFDYEVRGSEGQVLKQSSARVSDMAYLQGQRLRDDGEGFAYERRMLERWMAQTLR